MKTRILAAACAVIIMPGLLRVSADELRKVNNDFDGDGCTDPAVYYPDSGKWEIFQTLSGTIRTEYLGSGACRPVPGDYDGDGKADIGVFDTTTATWRGKLSSGWEGSGIFGRPGCWPVPADYDGDRTTDLAVYDPQTGYWTAFLSSYQAEGSVKWGYLGDFRPWETPRTYTVLPMPFDYDQDGLDDLCYYYRGTNMESSAWSILYMAGKSDYVDYYVWGSSGSLPAPGNYRSRTFDVPRGICVYKLTTTDCFVPYMDLFQLGIFGQTLPVAAGDYDGNGYDDQAVYNYETGMWSIVFNSGRGDDIASRAKTEFTLGGPNAVPANIYSTIYALALYSPAPW
ncbi:MAG: VCBS repeat-containing protein [Kiritimatiellae bacterium]|nr:VCBS repeat-containing protein [Kiritimatiellia bacterium]